MRHSSPFLCIFVAAPLIKPCFYFSTFFEKFQCCKKITAVSRQTEILVFRLLQECTQFLGTGVSDSIRRMKRDEFPLLVLAQGKGRTCDVTAIMQGKI